METAMERKKLESAAADYSYLRGLFGIPLGALVCLAALGNWGVGPLIHTWVFLLCVLVLAAACLPIQRYYRDHYGSVTLSTRQQIRAAAATAVSVPASVAGSFLLRSRVDWSLDWPVNPTMASFGMVMLACYAATVGLRTHHVVIWGALVVGGLLPVWRGSDPSNIGLILVGIAVVAAGLMDHRLLVRTFGASRGLESSAGA
jgi:hypothetical protein